MHKILLVEDNLSSQSLVKAALQSELLTLVIAATLKEAEKQISEKKFDLILLDVNLPDGDGFKFCSFLKNQPDHKQVPVFFITANSEIDEKVMGFALGAEDYIAKPFHPAELKARVQAKLRSVKDLRETIDFFSVGDLKFNISFQKAYLVKSTGEQLLNLTPVEFKILSYLAKHEEQVFSREQLIDAVRGENIHIVDRTIDTHVSNLRKKISGSSCKLKAVYSVGYTFYRKGGSRS